jgi:hypothetical protein
MAVAELYGLSGRTPLLTVMAQRGIDFLVSQQTPGSGFGLSKGAPPDALTTAWAVMALKSAKISELSFPASAFEGAGKWFDSVTDGKTHRVAMKASTGGEGPEYSTKALACALISRILMGGAASDSHIAGGGKLLREAPPRRGKAGELDLDTLYFGTLASFQLGGEVWAAWNPAMNEALVPSQVRSGCASGSWNPEGPGKGKGRICATALNVLSLEIYYRYGRTLGRDK